MVELVDEPERLVAKPPRSARQRVRSRPSSALARPSGRRGRPGGAAACSCPSPRRRRSPALSAPHLEVDALQHRHLHVARRKTLGRPRQETTAASRRSRYSYLNASAGFIFAARQLGYIVASRVSTKNTVAISTTSGPAQIRRQIADLVDVVGKELEPEHALDDRHHRLDVDGERNAADQPDKRADPARLWCPGSGRSW